MEETYSQEELEQLAKAYIGTMTPEEFMESFREEVQQLLTDKLGDEEYFDFVVEKCGDNLPEFFYEESE